MKEYSENEVKIKALNWLLEVYNEGLDISTILDGDIQPVRDMFKPDEEPIVPDTSQRLSLIEKMILAEGTAYQADILKQISDLNKEAERVGKLHAEWELTKDYQKELSDEYIMIAELALRNAVRNILAGEIEVFIEDPKYNEAGGYLTVREANVGQVNEHDFWVGYIRALIAELETGVYYQ